MRSLSNSKVEMRSDRCVDGLGGRYAREDGSNDQVMWDSHLGGLSPRGQNGIDRTVFNLNAMPDLERRLDG